MEDAAQWWWVGPFKCWEKLSLPRHWCPDFHVPKYAFFLFGSLRQSAFFNILVYVMILTNTERASFCCFWTRKYYMLYPLRSSSKTPGLPLEAQEVPKGQRNCGRALSLCRYEVFLSCKIVMASSINFISWTILKHFRCCTLHNTACIQSLMVRAPHSSSCWSSFYCRSPSSQSKVILSTKLHIFKNDYCQ